MKKEKENFVHIHTHSDLSQLDGCGKIADYAREAAKRGNPALSITEHGSMRSYLQLKKECEKNNIKPIYGVEFYVARDMNRKGVTKEEKEELVKGVGRYEQRKVIKEYEEKEGIRDRWHTTVWAMNEVGMKNLQRLSSLAYIDGFYYKPRVDLKAFCKYNEGLAISTGCMGGPAYDTYMHGQKRFSFDFVDTLSEVFGDRFFLEIQPHTLKEQAIVNKIAMELKDRTGAKLIAGQDSHYIHPEDWKSHDVLLCIGTNSYMTQEERFCFPSRDFYFKNRKQMRDSFRRNHGFLGNEAIKESLDTTVELAERCNVKVEIDYLKALLPNPGIPKKYKGDEFAYLKDLCLEGWTWRSIPSRAREFSRKQGISSREAIGVYSDRLKIELRALKKQRIILYFLIVYDLYKFVRSEKIFCGPGRGSAGGSLIAYLLGITSVDPIEYGLLFERFINPDRNDLPDIDMDFEDARRREVIDYLIRKYGQDKVCQISTAGKLSGKSVLRDVSRVLNVPLQEVSAITQSIIERPDGHPRQYNTIEDSFNEFDVCRAFDKRHPEVRGYATRLEGMTKTLGIHAAGVVASPVPIVDVTPIETRNHKGEQLIVSAIDMNEISSIGLVKLDVLGLRTLTVIRDCVKAVEERHDRVIDMERIDMNDKKVLDRFTKQDFSGVFQYDTPSAYKICNGIVFEDFEDIAALTALNRPGATRSGLAEKYIARKKNPKKRKEVDFHPIINDICSDTLGVIVYQEHCIKIFIQLAGMAPGKADTLRKAIGKKKAEILKDARVEFVEGCKRVHGISDKLSNKIFSAIEAFGAYGFNKSHATEYAAIAYWCQWLKTYYTVEFYWSLLKNEPDHNRIKAIAKEAKKCDIQLLNPDVSKSKDIFSIDEDDNILGSLIDIKGVGNGATETIMNNQPFSSFIDFVQRIDRRRCNRGAVVAMMKAGAMSNLIPNQKYFEDHIDELWKMLQRKRNRKELLTEFWKKAKSSEDYSDEERMLTASKVNPLAFGDRPLEAYQKFIDKNVGVKLTNVWGEEFWMEMDMKDVFVAGLVLDAKKHQIGDFHAGELPDEKSRKRQFWGKRYGNINIEGDSGHNFRAKFDIDIYDDHRDIVEADSGTPVIIHGTVDGRYQRIRAHFAINLEEYRRAIKNGEDLSFWQRIISGDHPASSYQWKNEEIGESRRFNKKFISRRSGGVFTGVVTHVRLKYDRKNKQMAFFGLLGETKYIDVISFSSYWGEIRGAIKRGRLVSIQIDKVNDEERGIGYFFNGGKVKVLRKCKGWIFPN